MRFNQGMGAKKVGKSGEGHGSAARRMQESTCKDGNASLCVCV